MLSTSGHIAAMVNPPGNPKASYQVNDAQPGVAPTSGCGAPPSGAAPGGTDWARWLGERSGGLVDAPARARRRARTSRSAPAPGTYVLRDLMPVVRSGPKLHWDRRGRGEPLLWITGFTISAAVFEPVLPLYQDHFDCVTFDNRGAGRSASPPQADLDARAGRRLRPACWTRRGIEHAHVFGISMGGMIAQELALRFPERVRGLILGGTTPGGPQAAWPTLRELGALGLGIAGAARLPGRPWLAGLLFSPEFRREQPERAAELVRYFRATGRGRGASPRICGRRPTTTPSRGWTASRRRRSWSTAPRTR